MRFGFSSQTGVEYEVESNAESPAPGAPWQSFAGRLPGVAGGMEVADAEAGSRMYYRVLCHTSGGILMTGPIGFGGLSLRRAWNPLSAPFHAYATVAVNIVGSFIMGILWAMLMHQDVTSPARLFLLVGMLGGFTTFSAFSLDMMQLLQQGTIVQAVIYAISSVALCICAIICGVTLGKLIL